MATLICPDHPSPVADAEALRKAVQGWGTDEKAIISILGHRNPIQRKKIRQAYEELYEEDLVKRLESELSGDFEFLVALVSIYRYKGEEINSRLANSEADILHDAIKEKTFDHDEVVRIISTRSKAQVLATLNHYKDSHGSSITKFLRDDPSSDYLIALRTTIRCLDDHKKYYEKVIRHALNGPGTDEESLTRVVVTRAEKDLKDIKNIFHKRNSVPLDHAVAKDTSGDYKAFLLTLLGNQD
ncbi:hypothetical protein RD792_010745 [Penstemon davidsonii]|uniref:Annexin n=1 Tax=Penstemon davidsonii TaxID=160366 RepID=A0ABR0D2M4_9LAMI|nr:hypothetical protein RD792_010745 [Penstemon davidsonii]